MRALILLSFLFRCFDLQAQYATGFDSWPIIAEGEWTQMMPEGEYRSFGCYCNFGNTLSGLRKIGFNNIGDALELPPVPFPESVRFQARTSTGGSAGLALEFFSQGAWQTAGNCAVSSETYSPCEIFLDVQESDVPLRIIMTAFGNSVFLDDLDITGSFLPVQLASFAARAGPDGRVTLRWHTLSENNNARFRIHRSLDGKRFDSIGEVPGHGTTSSRHDYAYTDERPGKGVIYYRLQQEDHDGSTSLSDIVSVKVAREDLGMRIYPLVVYDLLSIDLSPQDFERQMEIVNQMGRTLRVYRIPPSTTSWQIRPGSLAPGIYYLLLKSPVGREVKRFIKS